MNELSELIGKLHLSYRKFIKDVLRTTPVGVSDATPATSSTCPGHKPLYRLPKTEMPTYDGDPKRKEGGRRKKEVLEEVLEVIQPTHLYASRLTGIR